MVIIHLNIIFQNKNVRILLNISKGTVRYNLIKAIREECDSKIFCVGDDFQSIYRFSGCTLDLFVNFKKYFKNAKIMYINVKNIIKNMIKGAIFLDFIG